MSTAPQPVSDYVRRVVRGAPRLTDDDVQALREIVHAAAASLTAAAQNGRVA